MRMVRVNDYGKLQMNGTYTSESVSDGHPDIMCDKITDAILDAALKDNPETRIAGKTLVKTGLVLVAEKSTTSSQTELSKDSSRYN